MEDANINWIKCYILLRYKRYPAQMGKSEIESFLTDLAVNGKVAASNRNQAFSALLFLFKEVFQIESG